MKLLLPGGAVLPGQFPPSFPPGLARPAAHETSATRGAVLPGQFPPRQVWKGSKFDIVPGSSLLDHWYNKYGLRFNKCVMAQRKQALLAGRR